MSTLNVFLKKKAVQTNETTRDILLPGGMPARKPRFRPTTVAVYVALALVSVQTIFPLLWVASGSLKQPGEFFSNIWGLPQGFEVSNYQQAWVMADFGSRYVNSIVITTLTILIILVCAIPAAYALAKLEFVGKKLLFALIVGAMIVPSQIMAIPLFQVALNMGMLNSRVGVSIIYAATGLPLSIFLLRSFFLTVPEELAESARMDGLGTFGTLWRIMIPLVRPGVGLVVIFQFIEVWNEFFLGLLLLRDPAVQTIPLGLVKFFQQYDSLWTQYFAALVITIGPVLLVFLLMQKQFIAGLTAGAVKG